MHFSILCICLLNQPEWSQFFPDCFQKKFRTISLAIKSIWLFLKQLKTLVQVYLELMFKAYKHYSDQWTNRVVPRAWICEGIRFIHAFTTDVKFILCQWKSWWEQHFLMHKRSCWKCVGVYPPLVLVAFMEGGPPKENDLQNCCWEAMQQCQAQFKANMWEDDWEEKSAFKRPQQEMLCDRIKPDRQRHLLLLSSLNRNLGWHI